MDLPEDIKIPGAVLIAHGEIEWVDFDGEDITGEPMYDINKRGFLIFIPEPPVTKGETV